MTHWIPISFTGIYTLGAFDSKKKCIVQIIALTRNNWGTDYKGIILETGESFIFTEKYLEKIK